MLGELCSELKDGLKENTVDLLLNLAGNLKFDLNKCSKNIVSNIEEHQPGLTDELRSNLRASRYSEEYLNQLLAKSNEQNWPDLIKNKKKRTKKNFQKQHDLILEKVYHYYNKKGIKTDRLRSAYGFFICRKYFKVDCYFALLAKFGEDGEEFIVWIKQPINFYLGGCCFPCCL